MMHLVARDLGWVGGMDEGGSIKSNTLKVVRFHRNCDWELKQFWRAYSMSASNRVTTRPWGSAKRFKYPSRRQREGVNGAIGWRECKYAPILPPAISMWPNNAVGKESWS